MIIAVLTGIVTVVAEENVSDAATRRLNEVKAAEVMIEFYGQVLDQSGEPVVGATVVIDVDQATLLPKSPLMFRVTTDANGAFVLDGRRNGIRGSSISISRIERDGYEMRFSQGDKRGFDYRMNNPNRYIPNKDIPVVLRMRKKGPIQVFVINGKYLNLETIVTASGRPIGYDLIRRYRIKDTQKLTYDGEAVFPDLLVKATFNAEKGTWVVALSPGNANGGILASEQLLYEAPDTGYQSEYVFIPEDRKLMKTKYLYLASRDPAIYTRMEITFIRADKELFRLSGNSVTNPYGDRNLEPATDLPWELTKQLTNEVKAAFRQDKRPAKPDLPKLIKEAKEKAEKDKAKP